MILAFKVTGQRLTWKQQESSRPFVVADSRNYLKASFDFSDDWVGGKTAVFTKWDGTVYHMLLEQGVCPVPAEVIAAPHFTVSVFGGDRVTANVLTVAVEKSGCVEGETPPVPTPDVYEQLLTQVKTVTDRAVADTEQHRIATAASAEEAKTAASEAEAVAGLVTQMKNVVFAHTTTASEASGQASEARDQAQAAARVAQESKEKAEAAQTAAEAAKTTAVQAAQGAGWSATTAGNAATTCTDILAQVEELTGITAKIKATLGVE